MPSSDRDIRQRDLVPPDKLAAVTAVVIGVGAIGRQVALQLAAVGVSVLDLWDDDTVAVENLASQGFWESDLDQAKVEAVAAHCRGINSDVKVFTQRSKFRTSVVRAWDEIRGTSVCVFCCVDSIDDRKRIWEAVRSRAGFFADGRMNAEVIRVLASGRPAADALYPKTLFPALEAFQGSCTAKSTIYTANIAAGLMVGQFARWLRGWPVVPDQMLNLVAAEYTASEPAI